MKKIVSTFFILTSFAGIAQSISFVELSFKDLLAKAKKENKILFIDAYASWCGPCKLMDKNVFTAKSVSDYYNANFVNAHFDMEKGEGREIAAKYGVRSYPTFLFINGNGDLVHQDVGYMGEEQFVNLGKSANLPNNKQGSLRERFDKGEKDPEFLINIMKMNASTDFDFAKKASERYFSNKKNIPLTKDDVSLLLYFIRSDKDPNFEIFEKKKTEILQFVPQNIYDQFNGQIKLSQIIDKSINESQKKIDGDYFLKHAIPLVGESEATKRLNQLKLSYYEQVANFSEYEKAALEAYRNSEGVDNMELLKAAWVFADNVKNINSLKKACEWAEKSVMQGETSENTYILAKLYFLTGKKDLAKSFAEQSRGIAQSTNKDASLSNKLLNEITKK